MANLITIGPDVESQPLNDNFAALNDDIVNVPHALYRNAIINGNFDVWQRGTSFENVPSGTYTADRWVYLHDGTGQQHTISRQSFIPGQTDVPNNPSYFVRVSVTSAASGQTYNVLHQRIESVRTFAGKTITITFWAKADAARTLAVNFWQNFGSGGASEVGVSGASFNLTTNWQKFSCTVTIPSISGKVIGPGDNLGVQFFFPTEQTFVVDIAQVQLNAGDVALPFQPRSFAEELALCQRYFEKSYDIDTAPGSMAAANGMEILTCDHAVGVGGNLDLFPHGPLRFKVPKRITPTVRIYNRSNGELNSVFNDSTGQHVNFANNVLFTGGQTQVNLILENLTGLNVINAGDMVSYHWTADAEL